MSNGLPVIAIDCGHNISPDIGASYGTYSEDKIVLAVAQQLKLICDGVGIKTINCLPKSATSVLHSLQQRCKLSNDGGATIYVSIHCNVATPTSGARGSETYAISTAGKAIAANIQREYTKLGFKDRGVKTALSSGSAPYVLRNTNAIAVLTEICFLDAAEDVSILNQKGVRAIAQAIFNGITHGMTFDTQPDNHDNDPVVQPVRSFLVDAAKWYKGLSHQEAAFRVLESQLTAAQLANFKAAYSPVGVKTPSPTIIPTAPKKTVLEWITSGDGSTSGVDGLSDQIIREMGDAGLVKFTHPRFKAGENCDPYFHPTALKKLKHTLDLNPNLSMQCNSAYRSPVRQLVLREFYERGINGISAAAQVGTGNHERGLALDLQNWEEWKSILIAAGWHWQGMGDRWHYDLSIPSNVPQLAIEAYQRLANRHGGKLAEDGIWGDNTKRSMLNAPASGW
jgi:N-acetylmuramoyl-L-alanine amidase